MLATEAPRNFFLQSPRRSRLPEYTGFISSPLARVVPTGIEADVSFRHFAIKALGRRLWQKLIDQKLRVWLRDPMQLDDDGIEAPSKTVIKTAIKLAEMLRDNEFEPSDSVVPDGSGGIVFERRELGRSENIHIWDDATIEYIRFCDKKIDLRVALNLA